MSAQSQIEANRGLTSKDLVILPHEQDDFLDFQIELTGQIKPIGTLELTAFDNLLHAAGSKTQTIKTKSISPRWSARVPWGPKWQNEAKWLQTQQSTTPSLNFARHQTLKLRNSAPFPCAGKTNPTPLPRPPHDPCYGL